MQPGQQQQQHPQQHDPRSNNAAGQHRPDGSGNQIGVFDIPIFTEEFLDHNKGIDLLYSWAKILVRLNADHVIWLVSLTLVVPPYYESSTFVGQFEVKLT